LSGLIKERGEIPVYTEKLRFTELSAGPPSIAQSKRARMQILDFELVGASPGRFFQFGPRILKAFSKAALCRP